MVKGEKRARKKRLIKQIGSLLERAEEHRIKAETEKGSKDTTPGYWLGEHERFKQQAKEKEKILKKLDGEEVEEIESTNKTEKMDTSKETEITEPVEKEG